MKRKIALGLVLAMLLSGCAKAPAATEPPAASEPTVETLPQATEPVMDSPYPLFPNYDYQHLLEQKTDGAVGVYPLEGEDYYAVRPMGDGVLLFSGGDKTTLTAINEKGQYVLNMDHRIHPDDRGVQVMADGLCYYNQPDHSMVFLDVQLQETSRISLPETLTGEPVLSADGGYVYYFDEAALRCLELKAGISRLLKECTFSAQEVKVLHFGETVLECTIVDGDSEQTMVVSPQTGELLFLGEDFPELSTGTETYLAEWFDGYEMRKVIGTREGTAQYLEPEWEGIGMYPLTRYDSVAFCDSDIAGSSMEIYDLTTGIRTAALRVDGVWMPASLTEDPARGLVWFLGGSAEEVTDTLYCWDPALSATGETEGFVAPHYTDENPDTEGLDLCAQAAQALASQYRVKIRIWEDAASLAPEDYAFVPETRVAVYEEHLAILEQALSVYPETIFKTLGKKSDNKYVTINLVRSITGTTELGSPATAGGAHYRIDGSTYITVVMGEDFAQNFHHELFHAMDSYILTETKAFDFWSEMNPKGFKYDLSYLANQNREDWKYLEGDSRAFINMYSMSFPKEDRAMIMQYAVTEGNEDCFESKTMRKKLKTLCDGIRQAFKLKDEYVWEQYLD